MWFQSSNWWQALFGLALVGGVWLRFKRK
jgi:LPXTG-motif cell wall-anchored protein